MPLIFYTLAILCLLVALRLARQLKATQAQLMFFVSLTAAISLIGYQLLIAGMLAEIPQTFMLVNILPLLAVQAIYLYARYLTDISFTIRPRHLIAVASVTTVYLALLTPYWFLPKTVKAEIISEIAQGYSLYSSRDPLLFGISVLQISNVYFGAVGIVTFVLACRLILPQSLRRGFAREPVFYAGLFYFLCLAIAVMGTFGVVVNSFRMLVVAGFVMGVAFGGLYFIGEFFPWAIYESRMDRGDELTERRSYLKDEDIDRLGNALRQSMQEKKMFTDPHLSLVSMAAAHSVTAHQLSEYLNRKIGKRFTKFVNEYRIREAVRLIEAEPQETIRAVARAAGFHNEAYFSHVFLSETGFRPSEYRTRADAQSASN